MSRIHLLSDRNYRKSRNYYNNRLALYFIMSQRNQYTIENENNVPPKLRDLVVGFIRNWDNIHDISHKYAAGFTPNVTLELGKTSLVGVDRIRSMRETTIHPTNGPLVNISHHLEELYLLAGGNDEMTKVVFTGKVEYTLKSGLVVEEDFASKLHVHYERALEEYRCDFYKVYIDQQALNEGLKAMADSSA